MKKTGFGLIELLIALAGLGVLTSIVYFYLNPAEIFKCSRDVQRINDLNILSSAISDYISKSQNIDLDGPYYSYSSNTIFISIPKDKESTSSSFIENGIFYNLIQPSSTYYLTLINGQGWLPINFYDLYPQAPRPINSLPIDPINSFNNNLFYSYSFNKFNNTFELNAKIECQKLMEKAKNDGGDANDIYEVGTNLKLIPPVIYGYQRKFLNIANFNPSSNSIIASTSINSVTSTQYQFSNTGNAYLKANFKFLNTNPYIKIDKEEINLAPNNTSSLKIICDGRGLKSATNTSNTLLIFHNAINVSNPFSVSVSCNFVSSYIIKIDPTIINLEATTKLSTVTKEVRFINEGDQNVTISEKDFLYKETSTSCPDYIQFDLGNEDTIATIYAKSFITSTFSLNPQSANGKKNFYCYKIFQIGSEYYKVKVNVKIYSTPTPPLNLKAENDQTINGFKISWFSPLDDGYSNIRNYKIFYTTSSHNSSYIQLATTTSNYYNHNNLNPGTTYCYKVKAINKIGESNFSTPFCLKYITYPSQPQNFQIVSGDERLTLLWKEPINTGGSLIEKYNIYYSEDGINYSHLTEIPHFYNLNTQAYTHLDLKNGKTYYYKISAVSQLGEGGLTSALSSTPQNYPLPPSNLIVLTTASGLELNWQPPLFGQGSEVLYYNIYRSTNTLNFNFIASTTETNYFDNNVSTNTTYYYYITAINSIGESKKSNKNYGCYGSGCPPVVKCNPPSSLSATSTSSNKITLTYSGSATFYIYMTTKDEYKIIASTTNTTFTISGLKNGKDYYFYVTSRGSLCQESNPSNYVSSTPISNPLFPIDLQSERQGGKIKLKWKPPFSNEGETITNYYIYRATSSPTSTYNLIGGVSTNTLSNGFYNFEDLNIEPGNFYSYYVKAFNNKGLGFRSNIFSNHISICWANLYKTNSNLGFNKIISFLNNYAAVGWFYNTSTGKYTGLLTLIDNMGNIKKSQIVNTNKENSFNFILASSSYFVGGYISSNNYDGMLLKIASNGTSVIWAKSFGGGKEDRIINGYLSQREIALAGYTSSWGEGNRDVWFNVIDIDGNLKFNKVLGTKGEDVAQKAIILPNGDYILTGNTNISGDYDFFIVRLDNKGNILWQKLYSGDGDDFVSDIELEGNNKLILTGYTNSFSQNKDYDVFLIKLDLNGDLLKTILYKGERNDIATDLDFDRNGNYLIVGRTDSYYSQNNDIFILNISSTTLEINKQSIFNTIGQDNTNSVILGNNNNYLISGRTNIEGYKGLIFSFNENTNVGLGWGDLGLGFINANIFNTSTFNIYIKAIKFSIRDENLVLSNINLNLNEISLDSSYLGHQYCDPDELSIYGVIRIYDKFYLKTFSDQSNIYLYLREYFDSNPLDILNKSNLRKYIYHSTSSDNYLFVTSTVGDYFKHTNPNSSNCYIERISILAIFFLTDNFSNEYCSNLDSDIKTPLPPKNASSNLGSSNITISWQPPDYDGGSPINFYNIYRATTTNNFYLIATTTATYYNDTIDQNNYYCYYITASNIIGESDKSNFTCSISQVLNIPSTVSLSYTSDSNKITISWSAVSGAQYYLIKMNNFNLATTTATSYSFYADYYKKADFDIYPVANDIIYKKNYSGLNGYQLFAIGYLKSKQINPTSVKLEWATSTDLNESINEFLYFNIYRQNYGGSYKLIATTTATSYIDTNLIAGEYYCYQIKALYKFGESLPSNDSCLIFKSLPEKPQVIVKQRRLSYVDQGIVWLQFKGIKNYSKEAGFDKIDYIVIERNPGNVRATITPDTLNYLDYNNIGYDTITYSIYVKNSLGTSSVYNINVEPNQYLAKFNLYKVTLDNQMFFLGSINSGGNIDLNLTLGNKDQNYKSPNRSIYISIDNPPKYVGKVDIFIDSSSNIKTNNIKEFSLICDDYKINLDYSASYNFYPLYRFCSNMAINLIWDKNLIESEIPKVKIQSIEIY
jgi:fibronectin type 3 domain-containing protein